MARYDFRTPRLYVEAPLRGAVEVPLDRDQSNYLFNVLRLPEGASVLLFNGRDGEWRSSIGKSGKRGGILHVAEQVRPQTTAADLHLLFAPLKHARLDYLVQKAVEMGVSRIQPMITQHTQVTRVNVERMRANVVEAAQQCGILQLADVAEPVRFAEIFERWEPARLIVFCDEDAELRDAVAALARARPADSIGVVLGPEGGFSESERKTLLTREHVLRISLGPRILRADTAAVAALALVQAVLGDWAVSSG